MKEGDKLNKSHGMSNTRPYKIWQGMKYRFSPNSKDSDNYRGRGITLNAKWSNSFELFWEDMKDTYKENLSIDRIDNAKGYCKENCRWATAKTQCNNRRSNIKCVYKGETLTLAQLADKYNIKRKLIYDRYSLMKWPIDKCIETLKRKRVMKERC